MATSTISERLAQFIGKGGSKQSIRKFWQAMESYTPRPTGATRAMIHRYLKGATPRPDFVRAAADILGIDAHWLATNEGHPTEQHAVNSGSVRMTDAPRNNFSRLHSEVEAREKARRVAAHRMWYEIRRAMISPITPQPNVFEWESPHTPLPSFFPALADIRRRVWTRFLIEAGPRVMHEDNYRAEQWIGDALRGPLVAFHIEPSSLGDDELARYVLNMLPALDHVIESADQGAIQRAMRTSLEVAVPQSVSNARAKKSRHSSNTPPTKAKPTRRKS